uniref:Uncharacterized protein n=1 Tax=Caenorhabditis japonica TaxID=281687 RepID=A0A8R1II65_CAEJA
MNSLLTVQTNEAKLSMNCPHNVWGFNPNCSQTMTQSKLRLNCEHAQSGFSLTISIRTKLQTKLIRCFLVQIFKYRTFQGCHTRRDGESN